MQRHQLERILKQMLDKKITISEAAKQLSLESHVLRYWEMELGLQISRNNQGHRFYTGDDIAVLRDIKDLKEQGFQLKAIKMILPDIHNVRQMPPQRLYELREELNERVQSEEAPESTKVHTAQVMRNISESSSQYRNDAEEKLRHFEAMMRKMIRATVAEMENESEDRIYERITTKLLKEMDYLTRQREELHEKQVALLKEILAEVRHELPETATTQETSLLQSKKKQKEKKGRKKNLPFAKKK